MFVLCTPHRDQWECKLMLGVWNDMEIFDNLTRCLAITDLPSKKSGGGSQA